MDAAAAASACRRRELYIFCRWIVESSRMYKGKKKFLVLLFFFSFSVPPKSESKHKHYVKMRLYAFLFYDFYLKLEMH